MSKINAIQAAKLERNGAGTLTADGKAVTYRGRDGRECRWWYPRPRDARLGLSALRAVAAKLAGETSPDVAE